MKNRGQIAIFAILGLVILVIIGTILFISSSYLRKETPFKELIVGEEASDVGEYVTSCLDEALQSAVSRCSGNFPNGDPKCPDYEEDIKEKVEEGFCICVPDCTDFSIFRNIQVEAKGEEINIEAKLTEDRKKITVTMEYPILVKKGDTEYMFGTRESPFFAQYHLEQSNCIPIDVDENCIATETKTVEVLGWEFTFNEGQEVIVQGVAGCMACP